MAPQMSAAFSSWTKKQPKLQLKVLTGVLEISRFPTYKMFSLSRKIEISRK